MAHIAILGNYPPRRCGIATFTADLAASLQLAGATVEVIAMNDGDQSYAYPAIVAMAVRQDLPEDYLAAAKYINRSGFDLVCVQHEYGIFGGVDGDHLLSFLRQVNQPVVTTLHTILSEPTAGQLSVLREIGRLSDCVVTMSRRGERMLANIFQIPTSKISFAYHGIPESSRPPSASSAPKKLLTFGLISESKGIEYVIRAMPAILAQHPEIRYQIVGATHPQVRRNEGEVYRAYLQEIARDLGVANSIEFVDRFVDADELAAYISDSDIYITPYLTKNQITSGTLSYAFGSGKAVISTPYWHAEELLDDGAGILVPFRDEHAVASAAIYLLGNPARLSQMQSAAYLRGREMTWTSVGQSYANLFDSVTQQSAANLRELATQKAADKAKVASWPPIDIRHLLVMTDDTGILQHATHDVCRRCSRRRICGGEK